MKYVAFISAFSLYDLLSRGHNSIFVWFISTNVNYSSFAPNIKKYFFIYRQNDRPICSIDMHTHVNHRIVGVGMKDISSILHDSLQQFNAAKCSNDCVEK